MFERYWRNVAIRKVQQSNVTEYLVYYRQSFWSEDSNVYHVLSRLGVIETVREIPHKKRFYYGFDSEEENLLERLIKKR